MEEKKKERVLGVDGNCTENVDDDESCSNTEPHYLWRYTTDKALYNRKKTFFTVILFFDIILRD